MGEGKERLGEGGGGGEVGNNLRSESCGGGIVRWGVVRRGGGAEEDGDGEGEGVLVWGSGRGRGLRGVVGEEGGDHCGADVAAGLVKKGGRELGLALGSLVELIGLDDGKERKSGRKERGCRTNISKGEKDADNHKEGLSLSLVWHGAVTACSTYSEAASRKEWREVAGGDGITEEKRTIYPGRNTHSNDHDVSERLLPLRLCVRSHSHITGSLSFVFVPVDWRSMVGVDVTVL